jgi:hypothetical protein
MNRNLIKEIEDILEYEDVSYRTQYRILDAIHNSEKEISLVRELISIIVELDKDVAYEE